MTKLFAHVVVRNEADRFLQSCLAWNSQWFEEVHVYDGNSTDSTREIAAQFTDKIGVHPDGSVGFYEHEGQYRQYAWDNFEKLCGPEDGDWVLALDADEFLVGTHGHENPFDALAELADATINTKYKSVQIVRGEVWDASGEVPLVRIDGEWGRDRPVRYVRWEPNGKIQEAKLGCGSIPDYGRIGLSNLHMCSILHYGYSVEGEAERKHSLYSGVVGDRHNPNHIASIISTPTLGEWKGPIPDVWRGVR